MNCYKGQWRPHTNKERQKIIESERDECRHLNVHNGLRSADLSGRRSPGRHIRSSRRRHGSGTGMPVESRRAEAQGGPIERQERTRLGFSNFKP
ncbi:hypothetical protein ACLOJK_035448 [Asimina triloba]